MTALGTPAPRPAAVCGALLGLTTLALGVAAAPVTLRNPALTVGLDPAAGYAIATIAPPAAGHNVIGPDPKATASARSPWLLRLRDSTGRLSELTTASATAASHQLEAEALAVTWTGVHSPDSTADLTVTLTVRLPQTGPKSFWALAVTGTATGALWEVIFPRVFGVRPIGDDWLCLPHYWGRRVRDPTRSPTRQMVGYPQPASMQFLAYWGTPEPREPPLTEVKEGTVESGWAPDRSDALGLYWATEDGAGYLKQFVWDSASMPGHLSWSVVHVPGLDAWPIPAHSAPRPVAYRTPYETVIACFTGDYHEAVALYRDWARNQSWCQRGPADQWPPTRPAAGSEALSRWVPPWFRQIGFWAKFYHEPAKVVPEWAAYRKWLRVPMASHYYRYNIAVFDDNYPEHLPADPYLLQGVRAGRQLGVRPLPYINGVIWDTDTQSWIRENGLASAVKGEDGQLVPWTIRDDLFAYMCPAAEPWRAKMRETALKLVGEHGMAGVYLDCLAATHSLPCYDAGHGHPLRGGSYAGQGNRKLLQDLRTAVRRLEPDACFFTEEIGELYLDQMDGFLTLDLTRSALRPGEQVFPVFTAVYHPFTINFGSDAELGLPPDAFAWQYGQLFVWGAQPLISTLVAKTPQAGDENSEFLRDVTQAYYVAGQRFLQGGEWRRLCIRPKGSTPGQAGLELAAAAHTVGYGKFGKRAVTWCGPAVLASAWARGDDLGLVLVNITAQAQTVELMLRPEKLALAPSARLVQTWPLPAADLATGAGSHALRLEPRRAMVLVLATDVNRARRTRELDDVSGWELLTVESGTFSPVRGEPGSLWACSDSAVRLNLAGEVTQVEPVQLDTAGNWSTRVGEQAKARGQAAEGRALPRDAAHQPFLLARRLPHRAEAEGATTAVILSGSETHLSGQFAGTTRLHFARPGLLVIRDAGTGRLLRTVADGVADSAILPGTGRFWVGYACLDAGELGRAMADRAWAGGCRPLLEAVGALATAAAPERESRLAVLGRVLWEVETSLVEQPAALAPCSPLVAAHEAVQALLVAQIGAQFGLELDHDWLAPGLEKEIRGELRPVPTAPGGAVRFQVPPKALGAGLEVAAAAAGRCVVRARGPATCVERLLAVPVAAVVAMAGQEYYLGQLAWLEANRPVELQAPSAPVTTVAGRTATSEVSLRNWSPVDLKVTMVGTVPAAGWQVKVEPAQIEVAAASNATVAVQTTPPVTATPGEYEVQWTASYAGEAGAGVVAPLRLNVMEALTPLGVGPRPEVKPGGPARFRQRGRVAVFAQAGEAVEVEVRNLRVTHYLDSLAYRLFDPDQKLVASGSVAIDASRPVAVTAASTGAHILELQPGSGSAEIVVRNQGVAEFATKAEPLRLFCSPVMRWFYVPEDAKEFRLGAIDGGPDETARFVVTAPTGRVALDRDGNYAGSEIAIEVRSGEGGRVWCLSCTPRQDISFWLTGDVCPYLSASPEQVLAGRRSGGLGPATSD